VRVCVRERDRERGDENLKVFDDLHERIPRYELPLQPERRRELRTERDFIIDNQLDWIRFIIEIN